jgi:hypothetical protein
MGSDKEMNVEIDLIQFTESQNLRTSNSFKNKLENKWTWQSPDGRTKNDIDFILSDKVEDIVKIAVINNLAFDSGHKMVRATVNVRKEDKNSKSDTSNQTHSTKKNIKHN